MNKLPEEEELELEKVEEQPLVALIKIQMRLKSEVISLLDSFCFQYYGLVCM
jgi:hypothetical protein